MPVDDIRISLQLLAETVENLEKEIIAIENAPKAAPAPAVPQTDLFGGWTSPRAANDKNAAILAKKLDNTINKVQNLLKEAGA